jgi:hypothetical protein
MRERIGNVWLEPADAARARAAQQAVEAAEAAADARTAAVSEALTRNDKGAAVKGKSTLEGFMIAHGRRSRNLLGQPGEWRYHCYPIAGSHEWRDTEDEILAAAAERNLAPYFICREG